MRWLKKLLTAVLIYIGSFLLIIAVFQAVTGLDYSAAYGAVTGIGAVELLIGGILKITEIREERRNRKEDEKDAGKYP